MKKNVLTLAAALFLAVGTMVAQNDNGLIGRARGEAQECLKFFNNQDWIVTESVNTVSACFVDGFIKEVLFVARPVPQPCTLEGCPPPALPIVIATVTFGCDGDIISSSCY